MSRAFKNYFLSAENNKKADRICMELSATSNRVTPKGTINGFISPEYFLDFFSNLYIPHGCRSFRFLVLRLLEDMPLSKTLPQAEVKISHFLQAEFSENLFFTHQKGGRMMELTKWQKLNLQGYWLYVLINSTIFAILTFLVSVLLCHNIRCKHVEVWRFFNIFPKKYAVVCRNNYMKDKTLPYTVFNHFIHHMPN